MEQVIKAYASASPKLIERYNSVSSLELFRPMIDLLPSSPARVVDIGAGPGRDAAWLASMGHTVLAVEPVKEFRNAGMAAYSRLKIEWIDDRLPELVETKRRGQYEFVVLCAVWQHLDEGQRIIAMRNLAELTGPSGLMIMSLRHGPGAPERLVYPIAPQETVGLAMREGFKLLRQAEAESVQSANQLADVHWTWLAFRAPGTKSKTS
jgi:SAM-dependent methyltransferase